MMLQKLSNGKVRTRVGIILAVLFLSSFTTACSQSNPNPELELLAEKQAQLEKNKEVAVAFLTMIINDHSKVAEGVERYCGPEYIQHNPQAKTGLQGAVEFISSFFEHYPDAHFEIKRVIAEGDLVAIHHKFMRSAEDRGMAVVDIFRLENGRLVEHWDVIQEVPEQSAHENTMF